MNTFNNLQDAENFDKKINLPNWTAGPIISSHESKGFNRDGIEMATLDMKTYLFEVFPPAELAKLMQQPSPDVINHLEQEGVDTRLLNKRHVSFLAQVSLPRKPDESAVDITLISEQRHNGGVYKHEINVPRHMLCIKDTPVDTVLDSLNNAYHEYNWYPPY